MAAIQQAALNDVLNGSIRGPVQQVAQNLWQNKTVASLVPLQGILTSATQAYTRELTAAATSVQSRHQQRATEPGDAGPQRQYRPAAGAGAAIDARMDGGRLLLP